jgi:colanic acid/amylovoran biosynthesis glycosyltransferase
MDKIAIFLSNYLNSSETFIYERIVNFTRFKPVILSYRTSNLERFPYSPIYSLHGESSLIGAIQRPLMANFGICPYFEKAAKENNVKLIQAHFAARSLEVLWLSKRLGVPQVNFFHGSDLDLFKERSSSTKKLVDLVSSTALSITVSGTMKRDLVKLGCEEKKLAVNYAGIDPDKFRFKLHSIGGSKIKLLMCGRLNWKKGFEFGIDAFAMALKKFPNLQMKIIGDGELKKVLAKKISSLGLSDRISMAGELPPAEIPVQMNNADIVLAPSLSEGLPNVIKEAMASGVPVIATNVGGIPEIVKEGQNGFLVERKSPDSIAKRISDLIESPALYEKFSRSGRKAVEDNFDVKKQMAKIEALYEGILRTWKNG